MKLAMNPRMAIGIPRIRTIRNRTPGSKSSPDILTVRERLERYHINYHT